MELIKSSARKSVDNLFNSSTTIYKIPEYQRDYKWTKDEAEQFLEDFINGDKFEPQYLGVLVTDSSKETTDAFDVLEIIDGQQRLTTLFLIFLIIRKYAKEIGNDSLVQSIEQKLVSHDDLERIYRLKTHDYLKDIFEDSFNYKNITSPKKPKKNKYKDSL